MAEERATAKAAEAVRSRAPLDGFQTVGGVAPTAYGQDPTKAWRWLTPAYKLGGLALAGGVAYAFYASSAANAARQRAAEEERAARHARAVEAATHIARDQLGGSDAPSFAAEGVASVDAFDGYDPQQVDDLVAQAKEELERQRRR